MCHLVNTYSIILRVSLNLPTATNQLLEQITYSMYTLTGQPQYLLWLINFIFLN